MMNLFRSSEVSGATVAQAKVVRAATGEVEYHYSVPAVPWFRFADRRWIRASLRNFRLAEER